MEMVIDQNRKVKVKMGNMGKLNMSEQLLNIDQVAMRLGVVRKTVERHLLKLRANGLQQVGFGTRSIRFREASLDNLIKRAAEREEKLFD
jgi:predicted DNA-binding transcriptional regulator AlpA